MRLAVLSDVHEDVEGIAAVGETLRDADVVVLAGDLTRGGGRERAARVIEAVRRHGRRVLAVHGNCDRPEAERYLEEEGVQLHGRAVTVQGVTFLGLGGSPPTPMKTPNERPERALADSLRAAAEAARGARFRVLVAHPPPRDTGLDRMFLGLHVGSRAVREFVERERPDVCLCGHIHESPGAERLGPTLIVNPGGFVRRWQHAILELDPATGRAEARLSGRRRAPRGLWERMRPF